MFAARAEEERARTGSARLGLGSFEARMEVMDAAKEEGSLRLLVFLPDFVVGSSELELESDGGVEEPEEEEEEGDLVGALMGSRF